MARIIEKESSTRRLIKLSSDDIISIVQDYQRIVPRTASIKDARHLHGGNERNGLYPAQCHQPLPGHSG